MKKLAFILAVVFLSLSAFGQTTQTTTSTKQDTTKTQTMHKKAGTTDKKWGSDTTKMGGMHKMKKDTTKIKK
jgi:hypothetical protein